MSKKNGKHIKAKQGFAKLLALGYSQAQLARMFDVDTATLSQWARLQRVGAWRVGRANYIPEFNGAITAHEIRPDIDQDDMLQSLNEAKLWAKTRKARLLEVPFASRTTKRADNNEQAMV